MAQRLPIPGSDDDTWGTILNDFLEVSHNSDGTLNTSAVATALPTPIATANLGTGSATNTTFLRGDGTWATPAGSMGSATLAGDTDVSITAPANNQVLTYNTVAGKWENVAPAVASVFGRTGAVVASGGDYTAAQVTGALVNTNNLSDVSDAGSSRANIHVPVLTPAAAVAVASISLAAPGASIDGYSFNSGDLVLLTAQSTSSQNGLWTWTGAASALTRPTEFASGATIKGRTIEIQNGTLYGGSIWALTTPTAGVVIDTASQSWTKLSGGSSAQVFYVNPSGDATYVTDTATIRAIQTAQGSASYLIILGVGNYYIAGGGLVTFGRNQGIIGQGSGLTEIHYQGGTLNGVCIQYYDSSFSASASIAGPCGGFAIYADNYQTNGVLLGFGNLLGARCNDISLYDAGGPGSIGLYLHNGVSAYSEEGEWKNIKLVSNANGVVFDTGSFDHTVYEFLVIAAANQNGVLLQNAAQLWATRFELRGNFHAGSTNTGIVLGIDANGGGSGSSALQGVIDVLVECDSGGGSAGHQAYNFGGSATSQTQGVGQFRFESAGANFSAGTANFETFAFTGQISVPNGSGIGGSTGGIGTVGDGVGSVTVGASLKAQQGGFGGYGINPIYLGAGNIFATKLNSGANTFSFSQTPNYSQEIEIWIQQPSSGSAGTIAAWPGNVYFDGPGTLSSTNNDIDRVRLRYLSSANAWYGSIDQGFGTGGSGGGGGGNMTTTVYDPAGIDQQVVGTTATQTLTNKTLTDPTIAEINGIPIGSLTAETKTTNYVVASTDSGQLIEVNSGTAKTITLPVDGTYGNSFTPSQEDVISIAQFGTGTVTIIGDGTSTINGATGTTIVLAGQYQTALCRRVAASSWSVTASNQAGNGIYHVNVPTVTSGAVTIPVTFCINNVVVSATTAITLATTGAVDGQFSEVRITDGGTGEILTWVNTENSTNGTAPGISPGSSTLPTTVLFQFNGGTSKWRCMVSD